MIKGGSAGVPPPTTDPTGLRAINSITSAVYIYGGSAPLRRILRRECSWSAAGVQEGHLMTFFLFFIATFYRVKTLLTMLRIRDPEEGSSRGGDCSS